MSPKIIAPFALVAVLSGCMTPGYECDLKPNPTGECASMDQAYAAAHRVDRNDSKRQSVFESQGDSARARDAANTPFFNGTPSPYPDTPENGMPVYKQPKVVRVWTSPYVDADGNLRSGEYSYFATPGQWNYGTLHKGGDASDIFGPARPGNLGFNPVTPQAKTGPSAPPPGPSGAKPMGMNTEAASAPKAQTVEGITQPAQRFGQ